VTLRGRLARSHPDARWRGACVCASSSAWCVVRGAWCGSLLRGAPRGQGVAAGLVVHCGRGSREGGGAFV